MNVKRLNELKDMLEDDRFVFDEFDFDRYKNDMACGTVGCALGNFAQQSDDWGFDDRRNPQLKAKRDRPHAHPMYDAGLYFDIPRTLATLILSPVDPNPDQFKKIERLDPEATKQQVIENINKAIEHYAEHTFAHS